MTRHMFAWRSGLLAVLTIVDEALLAAAQHC